MEKTKVIISRLPPLITIMIDQKQLENVEYFIYLKRMMQEVHVKLISGFPWQKHHSKSTPLFSPANWA
jgi:hypothetical protein